MLASSFLGVLVVCAFVAIVAGPTCAIAEPTTVVGDAWVTAKTKIALYGDARITGAQVSVETVNGAVSLRGTVDSDYARAAAVSVTQAIDGVKSVRSDLQVVPLGSRRVTELSDLDITRQVEGRLAKDGRLRKVEVRTDLGTVILTGAVSSIGASARASELARGVPGVRMVKNEVTLDAARRSEARATTIESGVLVKR